MSKAIPVPTRPRHTHLTDRETAALRKLAEKRPVYLVAADFGVVPQTLTRLLAGMPARWKTLEKIRETLGVKS